MACFVLVHGSFHGPWCWSRITPLLQAAGHSVATPNLATTEPENLGTYAALVAEAVLQTGEPVILVGHSMGGLVITQAAELVPGHIAKLLYVSGLLLRDGETLQSFLATHADLGVDDLVLKNMKVSDDGALAIFPTSAAARDQWLARNAGAALRPIAPETVVRTAAQMVEERHMAAQTHLAAMMRRLDRCNPGYAA